MLSKGWTTPIRLALFIAGTYGAFSIAWILLSGLAVSALAPDPATAHSWEIAKGLGFVSVTAAGIGYLVYRATVRLEAARLAEQRRARRQTTVAELGHLAVAEGELTPLLESAVRAIADEQRAEPVGIFLAAPGERVARLAAGIGWPTGAVGTTTLPVGPGTFVSAVLGSKEVVRIDDLAADPRFAAPTLLREQGANRGIALALPGVSAPLGLVIALQRGSAPDTRDGSPFLWSVAHILAAAIERDRAAEALRRQHELLQRVADHVPVLLSVFDDHGQLIWANPAWSQTLGHSLDELRTPGFLATLYSDTDALRAARRSLHAAQGVWESTALHSRDGRVIPMLWANVRTSDGARIAIGNDISERQQLVAELVHTQKLEAVGLLAGGIAHDFNNVLTAMVGNAEIARMLLNEPQPETERALRALEQVEHAGQRAAALTRQLLIYSRRDVVKPEVIQPGAVLAELTPLLRRLLTERIEVEPLFAQDAPNVRIDRGRFEQLVMNLAVNARDAMPAGGRLTLALDPVDQPPKTTGAADASALTPWCRLIVRDTGTGIAPETLPRIFEPLFTTKSAGQGTGMGLATVRRVVDEAGGAIEVASRAGVGTTFTVYLPGVPEPASLVRTTEFATTPRGQETILLCEDDQLVRDLTARILRQAGYAVLAARSPSAAMAEAEKHAGPVHLLITDVVLPEMAGPALAELMRAKRPEARVLFVSGYAADVLARHGLGEGPHELLEKPFGPRALLQRVREVLDSQRAAPASV